MNSISVFFTIILSSLSISAAMFPSLNPGGESQGIIVLNEISEKEQRLKVLKKELAELESKNHDFKVTINQDLARVNNLIEQKSREFNEKSFTSERKHIGDVLVLLKEISQTLNETLITNQSIKNSINDEISIIEEYLKDPSFTSIKINSQSYFSYENLYNLMQQIFNTEDSLQRQIEEKNSLELELESKKREHGNIEKEIKEKDKEQKKFIFGDNRDEKLPEKAEIIDLNKELLERKKALLEEKIDELSIKISLTNTKIFMSQSKLNILKPGLKTVERRLRVYEKDIEKIDQEFDNLKKTTLENQTKYNNDLQILTTQKADLEKKTKDIIQKSEIPQEAIDSILNWNIKSHELTQEKETIYYKLGALLDKELKTDLKIELIKTLKDQDQHKLLNKEIEKNILSTWQKITLNKISTNETLAELTTRFSDYRKELNRDTLFFKEKINNITSLINKQVKESALIKEKVEELKHRENSFNKKNYTQAMDALKSADEEINEEININSELIKLYSGMISNNRDMDKQIALLLRMLEKLGGNVLFRSEYAISLKNIQSVLPELKSFASDVKNITITSLSKANLKEIASLHELNEPLDYAFLFAKIIALLAILTILFFILKNLLPHVAKRLLIISPSSKILKFIYEVSGVTLLFISKHLVSLFIWGSIFGFIWIELITQLEFKVIFYLISIIYLSYIVYKYLNYLIKFNQEHNYSIIDQRYQTRFYRLALFLGLATVSIFCFKEAFLTATYAKRELPTILDAIYSIIFRTCVIFLIGAATPLKDEILSLVPEDGEFWIWVRKKIEQLYYPVLMLILGIIIVSDPYIGGFGKLVSYILWGIIGTVAIIGILSWLQAKIRRISYSVFFQTEDESSRDERFPYAKTIYSLFVIILFITFIVASIYLISRAWGKPISFASITNVLDFKLFGIEGENKQYIKFTIGTLLNLLGFIFGAVVASWLFEHFILDKIFHILLVDVGVQNTIASISSYLIFIIAIIIGLMRIGISGTAMAYFLGAIAVAIAFAVKGPANDFIGYFILLVDRSLKIGDYVEFNQSGSAPIAGVVRKITPRTVILRRNNSFTTVVPNSTVINSAFYNWNYTTTFFAFDDIVLTVTYDTDPAKTREILLHVLDKHKDVLKSPAPIVRLDNFDKSGFQFLIRGFLSSVNVLKKWDIASDIRISIVKALRENSIKIAVPVRYIINNPQEIPDHE